MGRSARITSLDGRILAETVEGVKLFFGVLYNDGLHCFALPTITKYSLPSDFRLQVCFHELRQDSYWSIDSLQTSFSRGFTVE
jgi:hypothetical protein